MIRRSVLLSVTVAALAAGVAPSLAATPTGPSVPPVPTLQTRYVCVVTDGQPPQGVCVWAPLPV